MKRQFVLSATLFLLALLALPAYGQGPTIKVNVPFEFSLDDKSYPAGEYAFSALQENVIAIEKDPRCIAAPPAPMTPPERTARTAPARAAPPHDQGRSRVS